MDIEKQSKHIGYVRVHLREILQETGISEEYINCD